MKDGFTYIDEFIYATVKTHPSVTIWRSIDDEEIDKLADFLLSKARRDPATAERIDWLMEQKDRIEVAIILVPRFVDTIKLYADNGMGVK